MKTIKQMTQKIITLWLIAILLSFISCRKDLTDTTDITEWKWKLKYIETDNETLRPRNKDYLRDDAYVLVFSNDTTFVFNTSVNESGGNYAISDRGSIIVHSYQEFTQVGTNDEEALELDQTLLNTFSEVQSYEVLGNILIFEGSNEKLKFKME